MWTRFMDMHSGGGLKTRWSYIYIELPIADAYRYFFYRFGQLPDHVTCDCCGSDYVYYEHATLEAATAYDRGAEWDAAARGYILDTGKSLAEYAAQEDVLVVMIEEIRADPAWYETQITAAVRIADELSDDNLDIFEKLVEELDVLREIVEHNLPHLRGITPQAQSVEEAVKLWRMRGANEH